ncbi:hypothetical protein PR202_gb25656 [Eleusine coracana subsp. coracana]|uniref:Uncharacterized protein n=1 Tax=Eleusine coracana subsp. coracana TaxID=191504 RepID=A0AAV5FQ15_ELECO|nr:hypothetical protein PR202_gb25656 [Eleusine coracana subsp. coracana]
MGVGRPIGGEEWGRGCAGVVGGEKQGRSRRWGGAGAGGARSSGDPIGGEERGRGCAGISGGEKKGRSRRRGGAGPGVRGRQRQGEA